MENIIDGFMESKQTSEDSFECEWMIYYLDPKIDKPFYFSPKIYPTNHHPYRLALHIKKGNMSTFKDQVCLDILLEVTLFEIDNNSFHDTTDLDFITIKPRKTKLIFTIDTTLLSLDKEVYANNKSQWDKFDENCFDILTFKNNLWTKKSLNKFKKGLIIKINIFNVASDAKIETKCKIVKTYPSNFIENMKNLYSKGLSSDLTICVEDKKFPVHKSILMAHSLVFQKMLEHYGMESAANCITINDCNAYVFDVLLEYLYTSKLKDDRLEITMHLFSLSYKYDIHCLISELTDNIENKLLFDDDISCKNVCNIFELAYHHDNWKLKKTSFDFMVANFSKVGKSTEWQELMKNNCKQTSEILVMVSDSMKK